MQSYCKAYFLEDMQRFIHWNDTKVEKYIIVSEAPICFLWDDFIVRPDAINHEKHIFEHVTPEWKTFCTEILHFEVPGPIYQAREQELPQVMLSPSSFLHKVIPFTSGQQWLIEELTSTYPCFVNMLTMFQLNVSFIHLQKILTYLMAFHDALRLKFEYNHHQWYQFLEEACKQVPLTWICLSSLPEAVHKKTIDDTAIHVQQRINTLDGFLWHVAFFEVAPQETGSLLWTINHFISDAFSNSILFRDFRLLHTQLLQDCELTLPQKTTSFVQWASKRAEYIDGPNAKKEIENYWLTLPWNRVKPLPLDLPEGRFLDPTSSRWGYGTKASTRRIYTSLSVSETKRLVTQALDKHIQIMDMLLTAMAYTFTQWAGNPLFYIFVADHGRLSTFDGIDLSRTIGFIATNRIVVLEIENAKPVEDALFSVSEQLRHIPNKGLSLDWFLRRGDYQPIDNSLCHIPFADIHFNYLGRLPPRRSGTLALPIIDTSLSPRNHPLNCTGWIADQQLTLLWEYSQDIHYQQTIDNLAENSINSLRRLITFRCSMS